MKTDRRAVTEAGALFWRCPFCGAKNGVPERTSCECGAELIDGEACRVAADG